MVDKPGNSGGPFFFLHTFTQIGTDFKKKKPPNYTNYHELTKSLLRVSVEFPLIPRELIPEIDIHTITIITKN